LNARVSVILSRPRERATVSKDLAAASFAAVMRFRSLEQPGQRILRGLNQSMTKPIAREILHSWVCRFDQR